MKIGNHLPKFYILSIIILLFSQVCFGQESEGQASENFVVKSDGERIDLYGNIKIDGIRVTFKNIKGKSKYVKQKQVKYMLVYNRLYLNLKASSIAPRLQEVIAFNSDYILTAFWDEVIRLYIWDKDYNPIENNVSFLRGFSGKVEKNQTKLAEQIQPYFDNCPELMKLLNENVENSSDINKGISYYNCDSSLKPLELYLEMKK